VFGASLVSADFGFGHVPLLLLVDRGGSHAGTNKLKQVLSWTVCAPKSRATVLLLIWSARSAACV